MHVMVVVRFKKYQVDCACHTESVLGHFFIHVVVTCIGCRNCGISPANDPSEGLGL